MNGDEFGALIQKHLRALGFTNARYDKAKVSRMESGARDLTLEEAAVIVALDPLDREMLWLALGELARTSLVSFFQRPPRDAAAIAKSRRAKTTSKRRNGRRS